MMNSGFEINKSNWKEISLGELATEISERVDAPAESGYEKFVGLQHFTSGDLKISKWAGTSNLTSSTKAFKKGDILFARRNAYLKRASIVNFDGVCSGDAFVLRENPENIIPNFLSLIVNSSKLWEFANANAAGTMSKRVKWRDLAEYKIKLPSIKEQKDIFNLILSLENSIDKHLLLLNSLEVYKKSLLAGIFSSDSMLPEVFTKRGMKNIETIPFATICEDSMFGPRFSSSLYHEDGNIGSLRTTDLDSDGVINYDTIPKANIENEKFEKHYLLDGDLLISRSGTCGLTAVFEKQSYDVIAAAFMIRFRLVKNVNPFYIQLFFNSDVGRGITNSLASGAVQKNLTSKSLLSVNIPLPDISFQNEIVNYVDSLQIREIASFIQESRLLQRTLINKVF